MAGPIIAPYLATWDVTNNHLKPLEPSITEKVLQVVYLIFSILIPIIGLVRLINYGLRQLALYAILPAAHYKKEEIEKIRTSVGPYLQLQSHLVPMKSDVRTPDGVNLSATFYKNKDADKESLTIIYFNPNGALQYSAFTTLDLGKNQLVTFDYRGVGESEGSLNRSDELILDGSSVVQWVKNSLKIPPEKIAFYGWSLGGAVAANTQALDPALTGTHVNDRSFSSLDKVVKAHAGEGLISSFITWFLNKEGLNLDAVDALKKIPGEKLVLYHQADEVIPLSASLHEAAPEAPSIELPGNLGNGDSPHSSSLSRYAGITQLILEKMTQSQESQAI